MHQVKRHVSALKNLKRALLKKSANNAEPLASLFRSAIERAGLRLLVNCDLITDLAYVDREMWEKIVFNLLSNAFKFTFDGEMRSH